MTLPNKENEMQFTPRQYPGIALHTETYYDERLEVSQAGKPTFESSRPIGVESSATVVMLHFNRLLSWVCWRDKSD